MNVKLLYSHLEYKRADLLKQERARVLLDILLPLKPKFIPLIFNGTKKWEFRKSFFKKYCENDLIFIYGTAPIEKIVGYFKGKEIRHSSPQELWLQCSEQSGLSEAEFFEYFHGKTEGYAIHIDDLTIFPHRVDLHALGLSQPPQLYSYINNKLRSRILVFADDPRKVRALFSFTDILKKILPKKVNK